MVKEIGFYGQPTAGYIAWIRTNAGVYFVDVTGIVSDRY